MEIKTTTALRCTLLCLALCFSFTQAKAELAVVVNPANTNTITPDDLSKLYLGKTKKFPDGSDAEPLDRTEGDVVRERFVEVFLEKSEAQLKSYWSRLIFTGKGVPPKIASSDSEVKELVAKDPAKIGFIDSSSVDSSVKVVLTR